MRKIKYKLTILIFIISYLGLTAQNAQNGISNLTITPSNPNTTSQVKAIANCMFGGYNCAFKGSTITINNDTITVIAKHQVGSFLALCYATDTVTIGQLPLGNYTLIFHLKEFNYNATYDIDTLNFTVNAPTGVQSNSKTNDVFNIYPNPANEILNIEIESINAEEQFQLKILNNLGQLIKDEEINFKNKTTQIKTDELPNGVYVMLLDFARSDKALNVSKRFVIAR